MIKKTNFTLIIILLIFTSLITGCNFNENIEEPIENTPSEDISSENQEVFEEEIDEIEEENIEEIETPDEITTLESYFPLNVGNTWNYFGEGIEFATFSREVLYRNDNRAQIKEDNGGTVMANVYEFTEDEIRIVFSQPDSYDDENYLDSESNKNFVVIKGPIEVGTKWESSSETREIVETDASLDTPAGSFDNLLKIEIKNIDSTMYEYYKEGVGLIKSEFSGEGFEVTSTLENYNINE